MIVPHDCIDCKALSEQFILARNILAETILSTEATRLPSRNRREEMIGLLSELRDGIENDFYLLRRENHPLVSHQSRSGV